MEYVYTAMLLHSAGTEVNAKSVEKVLKAAGVKAEKSRAEALVASLEGVDIEEAMATAAVAAPAAAVPHQLPLHPQKRPQPRKKPRKKRKKKSAKKTLYLDLVHFSVEVEMGLKTHVKFNGIRAGNPSPCSSRRRAAF